MHLLPTFMLLAFLAADASQGQTPPTIVTPTADLDDEVVVNGERMMVATIAVAVVSRPMSLGGRTRGLVVDADPRTVDAERETQQRIAADLAQEGVRPRR